MKRTYTYLIFTLVCFFSILASPTDSVSTYYKDGAFISQYQRKIKISNKIVSAVTSDLVSDFHTTPGNLFNWALKDLGLQGHKDNELIIVLKSSINDPKTNVTHGLFDVVIPGLTSFDNIKMDGIIQKTMYSNGQTKVTADIIYSSFVLKKAYGTLTIIPLNNNEQLYISNLKIEFDWFFNLFITKRRYKTIVEWRIKKFTENMIDESERRQKAVK